MLTHPTIERLKELKLTGMLKALEEQMRMPQMSELDFFDRLGLLVDREVAERESRRLKTRLKAAKLRQPACMEDIDYRHPRGLDKSVLASLCSCQWLSHHRNILVTGPTGVGKTYIGCALAQKALREGFTAIYKRVPRLLHDLSLAKVDGSYHKLMATFARTDLLVLDDWGIAALSADHKRDILEIIEDRHGLRSTLITSQFPVEKWYDFIADPTIADAIMDRVVHNAYRIELRGESMRKVYSAQTDPCGSGAEPCSCVTAPGKGDIDDAGSNHIKAQDH